MKFSPEFNMGTLIQIGVVVVTAVVFTVTIKGELAAQKVEIQANKLAAEREDKRTEDAIKELRTEMKDVQKSLNQINEGVAILRGRSADTGSRK